MEPNNSEVNNTNKLLYIRIVLQHWNNVNESFYLLYNK